MVLRDGDKELPGSRAVVAHAFNPSTWEAEACGFLSSRPAWSCHGEGGHKDMTLRTSGVAGIVYTVCW